MQLSREDTAIVFIDPQNEVLSEKGSAWPLVRDSLHENNTIENMERIFKTAKEYGFEVFISLHYFYLLEASRHRIHCGCFQRKRLRFNQLEAKGLKGADGRHAAVESQFQGLCRKFRYSRLSTSDCIGAA